MSNDNVVDGIMLYMFYFYNLAVRSFFVTRTHFNYIYFNDKDFSVAEGSDPFLS